MIQLNPLLGDFEVLQIVPRNRTFLYTHVYEPTILITKPRVSWLGKQLCPLNTEQSPIKYVFYKYRFSQKTPYSLKKFCFRKFTYVNSYIATNEGLF